MKTPKTNQYTHAPAGLPVVSPVKSEEPLGRWYALYTRSRFEKKVFESLTRAKHEVFLPLIKEKRLWSDRLKTVILPLLPGYIFVRTTEFILPKLLWIPGTVRIVSFGGKPCEVQECDIRMMELIVTHGLPAANHESCCLGDFVRIARGPLKGWEGRVSRLNGSHKVLFEVESIGRVISVEVGMEEVEVVG